jgi:hypothetical protein
MVLIRQWKLNTLNTWLFFCKFAYTWHDVPWGCRIYELHGYICITFVYFYNDKYKLFTSLKGSSLSYENCNWRNTGNTVWKYISNIAHHWIIKKDHKQAKNIKQKSIQKTNSVAFRPRANYTDWATQLLWIEGCRVVSAADPLRSLISVF